MNRVTSVCSLACSKEKCMKTSYTRCFESVHLGSVYKKISWRYILNFVQQYQCSYFELGLPVLQIGDLDKNSESGQNTLNVKN